MAASKRFIEGLYAETALGVTESGESWARFLASAARNYKLPFHEQLLVFAQRPDATAVLELERWNSLFDRWVNRGARGIAVFPESGGRRTPIRGRRLARSPSGPREISTGRPRAAPFPRSTGFPPTATS